MKTDIVIAVWNNLDLTKRCLESVFTKTTSPYHLVIIDNASGKPTKDYLEQLAAEKGDLVTLIRNETNLGFVKAANQGAERSDANYVCFLNNDTEVTSGWLSEMIKVAQEKETIGIVNPNSNTLGTQPRRGQPLEELAQELKRHTGEYAELAWATGFCMLVKRRVIQSIGLFDEVFGMGNFEDADFSKRAGALGYLAVCARTAYVWHRERRSFIKHKRFDQNFEKNRQIFFARWGKTRRILYLLTKDSFSEAKAVGLKAMEMARRGHMVWIFLTERTRPAIEKHSNIYIFSLPGRWFAWLSLWRILKRKKKFDQIYVDNQNLLNTLGNFKNFHKAEVIYEQ